MSIRTFLFCDFCNSQGTRAIEQRRSSRRGDAHGRRLSDGRAWFEGGLAEAIAEDGWVETGDGQHACPRCWQRQAERKAAA